MTVPFHKVLSRVPFDDLTYLDDHIVRFHYVRERSVPDHWAMVLEGDVDVARLMPNAHDRDAVEQGFERLHTLVLDSFAAHENGEFFARAEITRPEQWLRTVLDHHCRPQAMYTNGQKVFSVVRRAEGRWEVAMLGDVDALSSFRAIYADRLPDADDFRIYGERSAAECAIVHELAHAEVQLLPLRKGAARKTLVLQPVGTRPGRRGYSIGIVFARIDGQTLVLELDPSRRDAYTTLNRLEDDVDGWVVEACATCRSFRFSGMARDMSGGSRGYCRRRLDAARASGLPRQGMDVEPSYRTVVSVFDRCGHWDYVADAERELPYCRTEGDLARPREPERDLDDDLP